ncbi:MAG: sugar transferase [Cyanobacteria bacterium J06597_16]
MRLSIPTQPALTNPNRHPSIHSKTKRVIDILGASLGIGITALLFVPLSLAIVLNSPGPIFYSQIRCGLHGDNFRLWKFRSMVSDADRQKHLIKNEASGHIFKNRNDPRVTAVGQFLRRTSLDELPQFWNVLIGDMSLVGTRPPTPNEVQHYSAHHHKRLWVKPGMTGEWQVNGRSTVENFDAIVQLDLQYQEKWSILYDLILIFKTFQVVFNKQGAY